jgi:hypothetical protein
VKLRRLVLLVVGAQLSAVCLWLALVDAVTHRVRQPVHKVVPRPPRDPRVSVYWEGRA